MRGEHRSPDDGFSLVEVIVSIMLISTVLTSLTAYFVTTLRVTRVQGGLQTAVQLATEAVEQARRLEPAALLTGRDQQSVNTQWAAPVTGVDLSGTQSAYDGSAASNAGATATLPTTYRAVTLDGVSYRQYWYVGRCWQPQGGGACTAVSGYAALYRVIVAVTWPESGCSGDCHYVTSTLVSSKYPDPLFNVNGP